MKLEKHGRASSGKRNWHINTRYFFVTDRVQANGMKREYCQTEIIIADFYINPLQDKMFRLSQNMIFNLNNEDVQNMICANKLTLIEDYNRNSHEKNYQKLQECVEKSVQIRRNNDKPQASADDKNTFILITMSDTQNIIANKRSGLLIRLRSLETGAT